MKRLENDPHMRTTNHSGEIAWLRLMSIEAPDRFTQLAYAMAAEALQGHDETGWSLDNWPPAREFVEYLLGHKILENGV